MALRQKISPAWALVPCVLLALGQARAGEVDESVTTPTVGFFESDPTAALLKQLDGLEKSVVEAATFASSSSPLATTVVEGAPERPETRQADSGSGGGSAGGSGTTGGTELPVKNIARNERVGEVASSGGEAPVRGDGPVAPINSPSTSTLSISEFGNLRSISRTLEQINARKAPPTAFQTLSGVVAQAQQRNKPFQDPSKDKKADEKMTPLDPNAGKAKFGNTNDLTLGNIAANRGTGKARNDDSERKDDKKKSDKEKEKEDKKKKEEQEKLAKEIDGILERDPFKFEDYEALRDLFNDKEDQAKQVLENHPKLKAVKDKIEKDHAPRDASPTSAKSKLLGFLEEAGRAEGFQNPIIAEPTPDLRLGPSH